MPKKQASLAKEAALRSVPRLFASGEQFDTRSVRRIFSDVHAAVENDQNCFLPAGKKLCEAFFDSFIKNSRMGVFIIIEKSYRRYQCQTQLPQ